MKGIILAGGSGSRLRPITQTVSKQLLPVYDKPLIYHSLSVLMLGGIRDILLISTPRDVPSFRRLFGDGRHLGLRISYAEQAAPNGLAEALVLGADHVGDDSVALILGDNIFHGHAFSTLLRASIDDVESRRAGCVLFGYRVPDPERYGIAEVDDEGRLVSLEEKPSRPRSDQAVTGLYLYDNDVVDIAGNVAPSPRGELEITDVNREYVRRGSARLAPLGRGFTWLDTGTQESLIEAGAYVHVLENRQGIRIACIEEIALRMGFIDADSCYELGLAQSSSAYGEYVMKTATTVAEEQRARLEGTCSYWSPEEPDSSGPISSGHSSMAATRP